MVLRVPSRTKEEPYDNNSNKTTHVSSQVAVTQADHSRDLFLRRREEQIQFLLRGNRALRAVTLGVLQHGHPIRNPGLGVIKNARTRSGTLERAYNTAEGKKTIFCVC
jgi:hypothetical protein